MMADDARHHPVLKIFDDVQLAEGVHQINIIQRHYPYPFDNYVFFNPQSLLASAITTFRYYPDEFIAEYQKGINKDVKLRLYKVIPPVASL